MRAADRIRDQQTKELATVSLERKSDLLLQIELVATDPDVKEAKMRDLTSAEMAWLRSEGFTVSPAVGFDGGGVKMAVKYFKVEW